MLGPTRLGIVHTAFALVAVACGIWALVRYPELSPGTRAGQVYLGTTAITAATGLGIFQHGGFGPPHALSILTLLALAIGIVAGTTRLFGRRSHTVQVVSFSSTFLFHLIPGFTETLTRLPAGAPVLPSQDAREFKVIYGMLVIVFAIGLALQLRWLRVREAGRRQHSVG